MIRRSRVGRPPNFVGPQIPINLGNLVLPVHRMTAPHVFQSLWRLHPEVCLMGETPGAMDTVHDGGRRGLFHCVLLNPLIGPPRIHHRLYGFCPPHAAMGQRSCSGQWHLWAASAGVKGPSTMPIIFSSSKSGLDSLRKVFRRGIVGPPFWWGEILCQVWLATEFFLCGGLEGRFGSF